MQSSFQQHIGFFRESLRNIRATGSIAPSSPTLCRRIVSQIDPAKAQVVVELGPGDGVITKQLLRHLRPDARLILFEVNPVFVAHLKARIHDPRVVVIHDGAENMSRHFEQMKIESVDYFISGIPFVMLPESLTYTITRACRQWLRPNGQFVQFHYTPILLGLYRRVFGNADLDFVARNVPPAFVIVSEKKVEN
jgi:phospholipid N-methyltransferase